MNILVQLETMWANCVGFRQPCISSSLVVLMEFHSQLLCVTVSSLVILCPPENSPDLLLYIRWWVSQDVPTNHSESCYCFEHFWLHFLFLPLCLFVILASLNSPVGTPLLSPISSILPTSWQKLVSCLPKLLIFLPGYMTRLHFLVFPAVRLTCGICMDPNYLLHTALSTPHPLPRLALSFLLHWHDAVK